MPEPGDARLRVETHGNRFQFGLTEGKSGFRGELDGPRESSFKLRHYRPLFRLVRGAGVH